MDKRRRAGYAFAGKRRLHMAKIHVMLAGKEVGTYPLKASPWIVGRHASCHVHIDNAGISRKHCQFTYENGVYHVQDLASANGTFVGDKRVSKAPVENGTEVNIGKYVLIFEDSGLEFAPGQGQAAAAGKPAGGPFSPSGGMRTFQMDSATLQQQMAKAGAAAADTSKDVVRKASDLAKAFDAPLDLKERMDTGKVIGTAIKIVGIAVLAAGILLALYIVLL